MLCVAGLTLTACSTGPDSVFDFSFGGNPEPDTELAIQIPEELRDTAGEDAEGLLLTSYVLESREISSAEYCAVDLDLSYTDGGMEALTSPTYTEASAEADTQDNLDILKREYNVDSMDDLEEALIESTEQWVEREINFAPSSDSDLSIAEYIDLNTDYDSVEEGAAAEIWYWFEEWQASRDEVDFDEQHPATVEEAVREVTEEIEGVYAQRAADSAEAPEWENIGPRLGSWSGYPLDDFDEDSPEPGAYFSDDFENATLVHTCAQAGNDGDAAALFQFPTESEESEESISTFAEATVTIMTNGELYVLESEVDGYVVDTNGDWIAE